MMKSIDHGGHRERRGNTRVRPAGLRRTVGLPCAPRVPCGISSSRRLVFIVGLLMADTGQAAAQQLRGRIVTEDRNPIAGASVTLPALGFTVRSDSAGRFVLSGSPGSTLAFAFRAARFRPDSGLVVLPRRGVVERDFTLVADDVPVAAANPSGAVVRGRVTDPTGTPLSYANVQVNNGRRWLADDSGRFQLPAWSGPTTLLVRRIGFEPEEITLESKPDTMIRVSLRPVPLLLKGVVVTGASAYRSLDIHGFYGRMRDAERGINHGYFITPEDIERRKATWITQMSDGFPTVRVKRGGTPEWDVMTGSRGCTMTVYLDNVRIVGTLSGKDAFVNALVNVSHVAAMEIYPRAVSAPPQYQSLNGTCGIVLLWTK